MTQDDLLSHYWSIDPQALTARLNTSPQDGLDPSEAARRLASTGPNLVSQKTKATPLGLFLNQFKSPIVLILLAATLISAFLGDWVDAVIILAIVLGSALLSFFQEYNASNAAEKLRAQVSIKSQVQRGCQRRAIAARTRLPPGIYSKAAMSLVYWR